MYQTADKIGDYTLVKFLGRGQYGEVWLAEKQLQFSTRRVRHALKFLINNEDGIDLKAAEAEIDTWIEASGHPNVMSVIDMLVHDNRMVIVSEFAEGGSLKSRLQNRGGRTETEAEALEFLRGILLGIEHLHSRNVIHRDLKPDNILLQGDFPRITDFGISRIVSEGTMSTKAVGSPAYMSPESFDGVKSPQADIWSAGVILYQMLTGDYPFDSETIYGLLTAIQQKEIKPLPETVSSELQQIVYKALEKDQKLRYQTAREMREAVEQGMYALKVRSTGGKLASKTLPIETSRPEKNIDSSASIETLPVSNPISLSDSLTTRTVNADQTGDRQIEQTSNFYQPTNENFQQEQMFLQSGQQTFQDKRFYDQRKSNKLYWLAGGIGGFIVLLMSGGLFWLVFNNPSVSIVNSNLPKPNISPGKPTDPSPAKPAAPAAPPEMAYVSGGSFMMGRADGKSEAEKPTHNVTVQPFFMDIYEVTNEKYAEFLKATNRTAPAGWQNQSYPIGQAKFPVVGVSWDDASNYAKWAGKRLPTEEEWEFAARGTSNFLYPWGNEWEQGNANVGTKMFVEVGQYKGVSPFGVYDMSGNAWEWTSSDFNAYPNGKLPDAFAGKTNLKTIRGGSFEATKDFATTTYRIGWAATGADNYSRTGIRCVKDVGR